jgi:CRP-like cAMP-binding protein
MTDNTLYEALRGTKLAAELDEAQCRTLAERMTLRDLADGDVLVNEGTRDSHLYVIVKGTLGVIKAYGTPEQETLNAMSAGDFAGELAFIDDNPRFASLVAEGATRVIGLDRSQLEKLLESHPLIVYRVMRAIVRTVHLIQYRLSMQQHELQNYIYKVHGKY